MRPSPTDSLRDPRHTRRFGSHTRSSRLTRLLRCGCVGGGGRCQLEQHPALLVVAVVAVELEHVLHRLVVALVVDEEVGLLGFSTPTDVFIVRRGYSMNPSENRSPKARPLRDEALLCADAKRPLRDEASPPIYISLIGRRQL